MISNDWIFLARLTMLCRKIRWHKQTIIGITRFKILPTVLLEIKIFVEYYAVSNAK
jgi:hypothetical protein